MTRRTSGVTRPPTAIDSERLRERSGAGSRLSDIISQYRCALPARLNAMQEAATLGAWDMLAVAAHQLAGASAMLGLGEISSLCRKLETDCSLHEAVPADWSRRLEEIAQAGDAAGDRPDAI